MAILTLLIPRISRGDGIKSREISGTVYILTAGAETILLPMVQIIASDIATNEAQKIINSGKAKGGAKSY